MRHTEEITITIKGLAPKPETYLLPRKMGKELVEYIETQQNEKRIPAKVVLPELSGKQRPATVLRGLRHREKLTQKELASMLGIYQHHLSEMEHGKRPIGKAMAKKLAAALGADWRVLV